MNTRTEETLEGSQSHGRLYLGYHSLFREVYGIIRCERTPPQRKSSDGGSKAQNARSRDVGRSISPRTGIEIFGRKSQDDEEYDYHGDPRISLVRMDISVPNETGHERQNRDDYDRGRAGDPRLVAFAHRSESQSTGDTIDRAPSHAGDRVQNDWEAIWEVEGEREAGKGQLAEAELRAECGEEGDGECTKEVEEDDGEDCGTEFEFKHGRTESTERESCCCGVGSKPHPHTVGQALSVVPLVGENSFNPSGLDSV